MATPIKMPRPGNTVEECILAEWKKGPGDPVSEGDVVAAIETDKAMFDVESPGDGVLLETFCEEGDLVPVLQNICVIGEAGEDTQEFRPGGDVPAEETPAEEVTTEEESAAEETEAEPSSRAPEATPAPAAAAETEGAPLSPRARRFLREHPFELGSVTGSGAGGRVMEQDLKAAYEQSARLSPVAAAKREEGQAAPATGTGVSGMVRGRDMGTETPSAPEEGQPLSNIRRRIADRMVESLNTMAQYTLNASADATALLNLRQRVKAEGENLGLANITINDMICYAALKALRKHPALNAHFLDGQVYQRPAVHLGFACDTPRGLMVPVIRDADSMSLNAFSVRLKELVAQTRDGEIALDDLSGATFTVSNLGSLGVTSFTPVINPPEVAILGVCATELKPVRRNGDVVFTDHISFSLTCDHRVVDGAPGARFLQTLTSIVENFDLMCLAD